MGLPFLPAISRRRGASRRSRESTREADDGATRLIGMTSGPRDRFFSGDVAADRTRVLLQSIPLGASGALVAALAVAAVLRGHVPAVRLIVWLICLGGVHCARLVVWQRARVPGEIRRHARTWLLALRVSAIAGGIAWGAVPLLLSPGSPLLVLFVALVIACVCGAALGELPADAMSTLGFILPQVLPAIFRLATSGDDVLQAAGGLGAIFAIYLTLITFNTQRVFYEVSLLRSRAAQRATRDSLTGLINRGGLRLLLERALARARRNATAVAVGYIDLDDFKPVNDVFGHRTGDALLRELAHRWQAELRLSEAIARLGGDEFVVVVEDLDINRFSTQMAAVFDRLHRAVEAPFHVTPETEVRIAMTMGIAVFPRDAIDADRLLRLADEAMYRNKRSKADRSHWWTCTSPLDADNKTPALNTAGT
jgi:diguanylate cyclase (GGDEF)-like protein